MYHVTSTCVTAIILYLISYLLYRLGFFSLQMHRRFWNVILATAFIATAMAGVFLALQINYKWNIPVIKTILNWHVELGIGLAITGLFHFLWHLNYYGKIFTSGPVVPGNANTFKTDLSEMRINLFTIGFISSSIQFLLLREILNITGGYELMTGSFLGSWLIASALGSTIAGRSHLSDVRKINMVFSLSPLVSVFLMLFLSRVFLSPGETPSFMKAIIYTFLVLLPFCLVSGFTFVRLLGIASTDNGLMAGSSFSAETAGGLAAGIAVSVLTAGFTGTYKLILLIILLAVTHVTLTFYLSTRRSKLLFKTAVFVISATLILLKPDIIFRRILLNGIRVTTTEDTPYGNITTGTYKGEQSIYYNQRLLAYNNDATEREEDIHYAMLESTSPRKIIIISGSLRSHLPEVLKYQADTIIYLERDPALARYEEPVENTFGVSLSVINIDAYRYIRDTPVKADVIILLIPPPATLLLNRYYTSEFFAEVKKRLNPGGIFMCSPGPGDNYFNKEALNLYSSVYNSLAVSFKNIAPVVGNKLYFIASDNLLSLAFCKLAETKNIKNIYVSSDFLDDEIITKKSEEVISLIDRNANQNHSVFPVACFHSQSYLISKNLSERIPAIIFLFFVFVLPLAKIKRKNQLMYFSASALAGFEIVILFTLQLMVGNMYQLTGLVIAGLMAGLATGSGINISQFNTISLKKKVIYLILFYAIFGLFYNYLTAIKGVLITIVMILLSGFLPAFITGSIFRSLTASDPGTVSTPAIYSADLAGSALGFILVSGFVIPLLGIQVSVFALSALVFGGLLFGKLYKSGF